MNLLVSMPEKGMDPLKDDVLPVHSFIYDLYPCLRRHGPIEGRKRKQGS